MADAVITRDQARLSQVRASRAEKASEYFSQNAESWDQLRKLHVAEEKVEAALRAMVGARPVNAFLDLGTGTGRLLQLFEGLYRTGTGVDASREMLAVARANLEKAGLAKATIRLGDIFNLPLESETYDLVSIHQVLHFLENPELALAEAARMLRRGGGSSWSTSPLTASTVSAANITTPASVSRISRWPNGSKRLVSTSSRSRT